MSKWEDIVKDKLEGFEMTLPEGSLARFHARQRSAAGARETKRFPIVWVMAAAVAAGIAALLLLRRPVVPDDGIQIIRQPSEVVAVSMDSVDVRETVETTPLLAQAVMPKVARPPMEAPVEAIKSCEPVDLEPTEEGIQVIIEEEHQARAEDVIFSSVAGDEKSPFVPTAPVVGKANLDVANAAASIIGGSGVALAAIYLPELFVSKDYGVEILPDGDQILKKRLFMPLRTGISVRVPISDKLSITSGIDYSLYFSQFQYKIAGLKKQSAHYLGIPLRLDGTLESNKWFEVYVGGGLEADYCIRAITNGNTAEKSGLGLSLVAAGGIQYKLTEHLGVFLEPELGLPLMVTDRLPISYHTATPVEFSVNTGIRITINK